MLSSGHTHPLALFASLFFVISSSRTYVSLGKHFLLDPTTGMPIATLQPTCPGNGSSLANI